MDFENKFIYLKKTITNLEKERRKEQIEERAERGKVNSYYIGIWHEKEIQFQ